MKIENYQVERWWVENIIKIEYDNEYDDNDDTPITIFYDPTREYETGLTVSEFKTLVHGLNNILQIIEHKRGNKS